MLQENNNEAEVEQAWRLTPKGFLYVTTDFNAEIWGLLEDFVRRQALSSGYDPKGIPAIVFDTKGGTCVTVCKD